MKTCSCGRCKRGAGTGPHHESYCDEYAPEPGTKLPEWKDETGYTYSKPKSEQPVRVMTLEMDGMRLTVHRLHGLTGWFWSMQDSYRDLVRDRELTDGDLEEAKTLALQEATVLMQERTERYEQVRDGLRRMRGDG